jgi:hypothetical protein
MDRNELTIKPKAFLVMLGDYFCEKYMKPVVVKSHAHKEPTGIWEDEEIVVDLYLEETIEIRGQKAVKRSYLSKEEIDEAIKSFIGEDYDLTGYTLQTNFNAASFEGVKVYMEEKQKKLAKVPKKGNEE